jgi:carboxylesterase type B
MRVYLLTALSTLLPSVTSAPAPTVQLRNGTVIGVHDATYAVEKFLGIPFAEPPLGDLRLRQSTPLKTHFGTLYADAFGPACYNAGNLPGASEDCLTLNIWRPSRAGAANASLPVLVWLYGGGLTSGYAADPTFEGTALTRVAHAVGKPVILVTLNYRLGPFGFLNGREMAELGLLNMGMLDQRRALQWVQENIAAFGGDAGRVVLAGESAGAVSAYSHMMAYGGRNDALFHGAILQSGGAFPLTPPDTPAFQKTFDALLLTTPCAVVANGTAEQKLHCIRNLPVSVFRGAVGKATGQSIDGDFTRTSIQRALPARSYTQIPTLVGANTDEGTNSAPTRINTTAQLFAPVADGFFRPQRLPNATVSSLIAMYSTNPRLGCPYNTGAALFTAGALDKMACSIFGDMVQIAPARMIARTLARDGVPVWRYRFNHLPPGAAQTGRGIGTGVEQAYVFSNVAGGTAWDANMAFQMSALWASFAHDLDPNGVVGGE